MKILALERRVQSKSFIPIVYALLEDGSVSEFPLEVSTVDKKVNVEDPSKFQFKALFDSNLFMSELKGKDPSEWLKLFINVNIFASFLSANGIEVLPTYEVNNIKTESLPDNFKDVLPILQNKKVFLHSLSLCVHMDQDVSLPKYGYKMRLRVQE